MIFILLGFVVFWVIQNPTTVVSALENLDFSVQLFNSLRRHMDIGPALIATAMGVLESGHGTTKQYLSGFNAFNITDLPPSKENPLGGYWAAHGGKTVSGGDLEYSSGVKKKIVQLWRQYSSLDEAVDDYVSFLTVQNGGRYKRAYAALQTSDTYSFVHELYSAGYFTLAPDEYLSGLNGALDTVKDFVGVS